MGCMSSFAKYLVFIFNAIIAVCAIVLIVYGAIYLVNEGNGISVFESFSVGGFGIGIGVIIFLIASLGCFGAIKQNTCMLTTYAVILLALFVTQIVLGVLAFVEIKDKTSFTKDIMNIIQDVYDDGSTDVIDALQTNFKCCGVTGPDPGLERYPKSCCKNEIDPCLQPYKDGCTQAFADAIEDNITVIAYVAICFAVVEFAGAMFAFMIRKKGDKRYA